MILTIRQKELLKCLLNENEYRKSEYFAKVLGISVRTLYKETAVVEEFISDSSVILDRKPGIGVKITLDNDEKLKLINNLNLGKKYVDELSTEKRITSIALRLLYEEDYISMQDFADKYIVSKTSIANDVEKIEKTLRNYSLKINKCYKGIKVIGDEKNIRRAINYYIKLVTKEDTAEKLIDNSKLRLDIISYSQLLNFFGKDVIRYSEECIINLEKQLKYSLSDILYSNLVIHLLILIKRVEMGKVTHAPISKEKNIQVYNSTLELLRFLERKLNIRIPECEAVYFYEYVLGCNRDITNIDSSKLYLREIEICIAKMCGVASKILSLNLENDIVLKKGLLLHLSSMINRCKYNIKIDNPILNDIREQYYQMYSITQLLAIILEDTFSITINEDEIGFITLHFSAAVERAIIKEPKKVLVVCYGGIGTSEFLANRIRNSLSNIKIVDVIPSGKLDEIDTEDIDFIISTVYIKYNKKPVINISPLLNVDDVNKLNEYMIILNNTNSKEKSKDTFLSQILDKDLIFIENTFQHKEETISFLCKEMLKKGYVTTDYISSVLAREKIASTYIGNSIAIPHGYEEYIIEEKIVICVLKNPIMWDGEKVKLVFLISIRTQGKNKFKEILKSLYSLLEDRKTIESVGNCTSPTEIYNIINTL